MGTLFTKGFDPRYPFFKDKFDLVYYVKKPELIPLVLMKVISCINWMWLPFYMTLSKNDVVAYNDKKKKPWDRIDLNNPKVVKFKFVLQEYKPMPELAKIYKSMEDKEKELTEL